MYNLVVFRWNQIQRIIKTKTSPGMVFYHLYLALCIKTNRTTALSTLLSKYRVKPNQQTPFKTSLQLKHHAHIFLKNCGLSFTLISELAKLRGWMFDSASNHPERRFIHEQKLVSFKGIDNCPISTDRIEINPPTCDGGNWLTNNWNS